jgi:predicted Rossmann-fold nucleotide-binding protein
MLGALTITGSRRVPSAPDARLTDLFEEFVAPFARRGTTVHVGGAAGVDTAALDWLARSTGAAVVVVVPCTVADQPDVAAASIRRWQDTGRLAAVVELGAVCLGSAAYHARNRWMVDRSRLVVGFPLGDEPTGGTRYTLDHAAALGIPRLVVPV